MEWPGASASPVQLSNAAAATTPLRAGDWHMTPALQLAMGLGLDPQRAAPLQAKAEGDLAGAADLALPAGGGAQLAPATRDRMEHAFSADFSAVRVHEGDHVSTLGARAFARGSDLHFAPGAYAPGTAAGDELIGHELAHVVQQSQGRVTATAQASGLPINADPALEREADELGARAARGEQVSRVSAAIVTGGEVAQGVFEDREGRIKKMLVQLSKGSRDSAWHQETNVDQLIAWAASREQAEVFLEHATHAQWLLVKEFYPEGHSASKIGTILGTPNEENVRTDGLIGKCEAKKREEQSSDSSTLLAHQADRISDARIRTNRDDPRANFSNVVVFLDEEVLGKHAVPFRSGEQPDDRRYQIPSQHLNTDHFSDKERDSEERMSAHDSEVALLQYVEDLLNAARARLKKDSVIVVQIMSSYGACDNCKDRLDDFVKKWPNAKIEYHYGQQQLRDPGGSTSGREGRMASYGWRSDRRAKGISRVSHGDQQLYRHVVDQTDLEARQSAASIAKKPPNEQPSPSGGPDPALDNSAPQAMPPSSRKDEKDEEEEEEAEVKLQKLRVHYTASVREDATQASLETAKKAILQEVLTQLRALAASQHVSVLAVPLPEPQQEAADPERTEKPGAPSPGRNKSRSRVPAEKLFYLELELELPPVGDTLLSIALAQTTRSGLAYFVPQKKQQVQQFAELRWSFD